MRIVIEEPMHNEGRGGVSVYTRSLLSRLAVLAPEDEFVLFSYFFRERERRTARLRPGPGERWTNWTPRVPESLVSRLEWDWGLAPTGRYLRARGGDLFHTQRTPRVKLLPTVVTIHDLFPAVHPEWVSPFTYEQCERILRPGMERVDRVIAVSAHTKQDIVERWGVAPERVTVIHEGVDRGVFHPSTPERIAQVRAAHALPARFVLMVGPFDPWCDPGAVLEAASRLPASLKDVGIVFAGNPGSVGEAVRRRAAELGLTERCRWPGFVPHSDLVAFYGAADALVYPSLYEGFGLPILEAMACGTPVITSDRSSMPEVAGDAAILVDPTDSEAVRAALVAVLDDGGKRADLRERGLARAAQLTWEEAARRTLAVYDSLLGR
ncbi:MAG: hypothetical protein A2X36_01315 [Elusimicrobia bacterium GWA2_69_24]|nr:MAG: hypothetical protein A2X36_01315 [Elusimicrobia bacterium GWA2_69_24]